MQAFGRSGRGDLVPVSPAIAEPSTGESMGQSAEKMAKENGISREEQDRWALRSHQLAAAGDRRRSAHRRDRALVRRRNRATRWSMSDNGIRTDTRSSRWRSSSRCSIAATARLRRRTASPLTDGASAVLLMSEDKAQALGYDPLAFIRSYAVAAVDPGWQLLRRRCGPCPRRSSAPAFSGSDLGLIEIHEAFAAQVLSNLQGFAGPRAGRSTRTSST